MLKKLQNLGLNYFFFLHCPSQLLVNQSDGTATMWTPLMFACRWNNFRAVERLVKVAGVDIMFADNTGNTAVIIASELGRC